MDPSVTGYCERAPERSLFPKFPVSLFRSSAAPQWLLARRRREDRDWDRRRRRHKSSLPPSLPSPAPRGGRGRGSERAGAASVGDTTCQRESDCVRPHPSFGNRREKGVRQPAAAGDGRMDGRREREREISAENLPTAFASRPARLPPLRNWRTDSGKRS